MSVVGMVLGSLLRQESAQAEARPHVRHSER
jgi:hypothetical protein